MRYYSFVLNANADDIKDHARINLRQYDYGNSIAAMNCYICKNMKNDLCFFAYREEENSIFAAFSYNEKKGNFQDAYDYIAEMLNDAFQIKKIKVNPYPQIKKYVIPVMIREGVGDRKAAVNYMEELIKGSEYFKYESQASEFMKQFPETNLSQTDVLMAYEQFDAWCLNKNVLQALDRDENVESSYDKLNKMIGLEIVKKQIEKIIAADIVEKERKKRKEKDYKLNTMHMIFGGNPGSAKTTVAKLFAGIAKEKGILKSGVFVERGGMDLDGSGCVTAIRESFMAAKGGVLFIDEAFSLKSDTAVTVLLQEMENQRDNVTVILAGNNERMQEFMKINEGLKSRIPYWIEFPDYTADELTDIFRLMLQERGLSATDDAIREAHYIFEKVRNADNFGNGGYVRKLIECAMHESVVRLLSVRRNVSEIRKGAFFLITKADINMSEKELKKERVGERFFS